MNKLIIFITLLFIGAASFAASGTNGLLVSLGFFKFDQETEGNQIGNSKSLNTYNDLKIGYLLGNQIYLGGVYSTYSQDNGSSINKRTLYGMTAGYHNAGWYLDGSYFFDGQLEVGSSTFSKASGYGFDLGYAHMVNSNFFVGIQMSYKTYTFKEYSSGGSTLTSDNKVKSEMYPMLVLGVNF